jgi:hypothetical protein
METSAYSRRCPINEMMEVRPSCPSDPDLRRGFEVRDLSPDLQWLRQVIVTQLTERVSEVLLFKVLQPGWCRLARSGQKYSSESLKNPLNKPKNRTHQNWLRLVASDCALEKAPGSNPVINYLTLTGTLTWA